MDFYKKTPSSNNMKLFVASCIKNILLIILKSIIVATSNFKLRYHLPYLITPNLYGMRGADIEILRVFSYKFAIQFYWQAKGIHSYTTNSYSKYYRCFEKIFLCILMFYNILTQIEMKPNLFNLS